MSESLFRAAAASCLALALALSCGKAPSSPSGPDLPSCGAEPPDVPMPPAPCPSRAEIEQIDRDVRITFRNDPSAGTVGCRARDGSADLTVLQANTYMQLAFMRRKVFSRALPWTGKTAYDWFRETIDGMVVEGSRENSYCCRPDRVIHIMYSPDRAWTREWLTWGNAAPVVLIHEARHIDFGGHTCGNRDVKIEEMGAAGATYTYLHWVAEYGDEPEDLRAHWRHRAWVIRLANFCAECAENRFLLAPPG